MLYYTAGLAFLQSAGLEEYANTIILFEALEDSNMSSANLIQQQEIWPVPGLNDVSCTVKRSAKAKYIRLTVHPEKGVVLTLPIGVKEAQGQAFLQKQCGWI